ncbi:hypothetical protein T265_09303 [Opisthorchis viverrini]|uniref:Uncharacterized protein n=1 Tax=Opisthorchis viverrini TaxID=6198 RepID=A0A074Z678_OPIVI|nr:hypothetical protein T265_09303 [Opisthorchis viverrini]KER22641.1 hypothetical protein T265_09303 [Opisthorchis viverrini]
MARGCFAVTIAMQLSQLITRTFLREGVVATCASQSGPATGGRCGKETGSLCLFRTWADGTVEFLTQFFLLVFVTAEHTRHSKFLIGNLDKGKMIYILHPKKDTQPKPWFPLCSLTYP